MDRSILRLVALLAFAAASPVVVFAGGAGEDCSQPQPIASLPFTEGNLTFGGHTDDRDASGFSCTTTNGVDRVYQITVNPNNTASCQVNYVSTPTAVGDGIEPTTAVVSGGCSSSVETFCEAGSQPSAITFPSAGTYYIWLDWADSLVTASIDCTGALPVELTDFEIE